MRDGIETACHTRRDGTPHPSALRAYTQRTPFVYLRMRHAAPDTRRAKVLVLVIADSVLLTDGMPPTAGDHRAGDMHSTHTKSRVLKTGSLSNLYCDYTCTLPSKPT